MKRLLYALLILSSFLGCIKETIVTAKYTVRNESGKGIMVLSYISKNPQITPIITRLASDEELTKEESNVGGIDYSYADFFGEGYAYQKRDSISIVFGGSKIQSFKTVYSTDENDLRNPLNEAIYSGLEEVFVFTKEDYENAEDCNEDCE